MNSGNKVYMLSNSVKDYHHTENEHTVRFLYSFYTFEKY